LQFGKIWDGLGKEILNWGFFRDFFVRFFGDFIKKQASGFSPEGLTIKIIKTKKQQNDFTIIEKLII
jgi:hypothetical protein